MSVLVEPETSAPADTPNMSLVVVDMVWPDQSNHHGTLFGGAALSMLDRMAFIVGSKVLRGSVVTAAVSRLDFAAPAPAGHLVECRAEVLQRGRRSVTVDTRLIAEDLLSGARTHCLSGEFVMVRQADEAPADAAEAAEVAQARHEAGAENTAMACATVAEIVFPGHVNHRGVLHGGPAMAWMAKAGFVAATRQVRRPVVMAGTEQLDFVASARVPMRTLREGVWLLRESGSGTREATDQSLLPHLRSYRRSIELGSSEAIKHAAEAGMGVACLSSWVVSDALEAGRLCRISTTLPRQLRQSHLVVHRDKQPTASLLAFVDQVFGAENTAP